MNKLQAVATDHNRVSKRCPGCCKEGVRLPFERFARNAARHDGHQPRCRACESRLRKAKRLDRRPQVLVTKEDRLLECVNALLGGEVKIRKAEGWSNSSADHLLYWLRSKKIDNGAPNRGRYVTEPWWCLPERREQCVKAGRCLRGNCLGTRRENFKKCRRLTLYQLWGFTTK